MKQLAAELVRAACSNHPALPSRTIARKLLNENKGIWNSIEECRGAIRYYRGKSGKTNRHHGRKGIIASTCPHKPWNPETYIPDSDEGEFTPHVVQVDTDTRGLVLGDIHVPYHNVKAVRATLNQGKKEDCKIVILNGDTLDFHRLSRFMKDPRARSAKKEIDLANELLDSIDDLFPKALKIWKDGNHDERYDHYIIGGAGEVYELIKGKASLDIQLELKERGWEYVSEKRPIYLGHLTVIHGHEYPTPVLGPVNAARGLFLRTKAPAMVNHHHQTSEHTEPTIRDKIITTWSLGCLCDLHPMYARFNKWNHGAATVELAKSGDFRVHNFRIANGVLLN